MQRINVNKILLLVTTLLVVGLIGLQARADTIEVDKQPLADALRAFSDQTLLQFAYVATLAENKISPGTRGKRSPKEALTDILKGTELQYQYVNPSTVAIGPKRSGAVRNPSPGEDGSASPPILMAQLQTFQAVDAEEEEEPEEEADEPAPAEEEDELLELDEQRVTGSRLQGGDPTTRVISFTAEEIAARGISSIEELFRKMPWAYPSLTTQSNMDYDGPSDVEAWLRDFGLGVSLVNLRALGSQNTLVLINGRRVAGVGGSEHDRVNLMNIPLSAIERVDIELGSASAVYGSDAIGGVVNFITKKQYKGLEATVRQEYSATDADRRKASLRGGFSWLTGSMTANVSSEKSKPINNHRIWTSYDYRDLWGPEYDLRDYRNGQPGAVCTLRDTGPSKWRFPRCDYYFTFNPFVFHEPVYQLPAGHSGENAAVDDFLTEIQPFDYVEPYNGADSNTLSFNLRAEQHFGNDLMIYAEALVSQHDAYRAVLPQISYIIPDTNAYNPFGEHLFVRYTPAREVESGFFAASSTDTERKHRTYTAGFIWKFGEVHELNLNLNRSESRYSGLSSNHRYGRREGDPTATEFYRTLESSDPAVAFNPFGDGSIQSPRFAALLTPAMEHSGRTGQTSLEAILRGSVFDIWGGPINYVIGGEQREKMIRYDRKALSVRDTFLDWYRSWDLPAEPRNELSAAFVELGFPIVGENNARPGLAGLYLSLQARYDEYTYLGPLGGRTYQGRAYVDVLRRVWVPGTGWTSVGGWVSEYGGEINLAEVQNSDTTPRVGLQYKPTDSISIRAAWTQSFHPPVIGDQFSPSNPSQYNTTYIDPHDPDGEGIVRRIPNIRVPYNPDLRSEYADKNSLSFDWQSERIPGLWWTVDWSRIEYTDKIVGASDFRFLFPESYAANPELAPRDADGYVTSIVNKLVNLSEKVSEFLETSVQYSFSTGVGSFTPRLMYSKTLKEYYKLVGAADPIDRVSTRHGSDKYRLNGQLSWQWRQFAADLFVYFRPGYTNAAQVACPKVVGRCKNIYQRLPELELGSFTTIDLTLSYQFDNGLRVRAGGLNLLKREAPTIYGRYPYDIVRWNARSRVLFMELHWAM